nr:probable protein phosphatase 2C 12 [Tanacetum cinerariifolium]
MNGCLFGKSIVTVASVKDARCILESAVGSINYLSTDHRLDTNEEDGEVGQLNNGDGLFALPLAVIFLVQRSAILEAKRTDICKYGIKECTFEKLLMEYGVYESAEEIAKREEILLRIEQVVICWYMGFACIGALSVNNGRERNCLPIRQVDVIISFLLSRKDLRLNEEVVSVKNVFLNNDLNEGVYIIPRPGVLKQPDGDLFPDPTLYRTVVVSLVYFTVTLSDIVYVVHIVSQFIVAPRIVH